jgi:predicted nicotinamide N-methyase
VVSTLEFAGLPLRVVRPGEPDRLLDDPAVLDWNRHDDYMPYWAYLWPGACLLAEVVAREPWPTVPEGAEPPRALEIGCGVGLAGLTALARGLHVCFSDYDPAPFSYVARSAEANGFEATRYAFRLIDWREPPDETFPVILGSDVLYERRLVPLVAGVLSRMLPAGGLGLISCPGRPSGERFPEVVRSLGLDCQVESVESRARDGEFVSGLVYRVRRAP